MAWAAGPTSSWAKLTGEKTTVVAVEVSLAEAVACADKLGGRLPTPAEWDAAAGYSTRMPRPDLVVSGAGAVDSALPGDVFTPKRDVTSTGVSNMTGNGREWTSGTLTTPDGKKLSVLRGRSFTLAKALTAADLEAEQDVPQTQYAEAKSKYTGFRVVLDLPNP